MQKFNQEYVHLSLSVIGGKWKSTILWNLKDKPLRFNELLRTIPEISKKMLVQQLRQLESDQIIVRKVYNVVPPKVEYSISEYGASLCPVLQAMHFWGESHKEMVNSNQK